MSRCPYLSPQFSRKWRSSLFLNIFSDVEVTICSGKQYCTLLEEQESRAVARKSRDAAAVLFGLKFADNIHLKSSQALKERLQTPELQTTRRKTEFNSKWLF